MHIHSDHNHNSHTAKDSRALLIALTMTFGIFFTQIIGSYLSHSLALLSDAGHMLTDIGALVIAYAALKIFNAGKKGKNLLNTFTFGFKRIEVVAALINGVILFAMCGFLIYESILRLFETHDVHTEPMLITSIIGLIANMISAYMLHDSHHLSTKSAYLHVITDLLSSVAVIIGGILMYYTGFLWIDTILSAGISVFIIRSAIRLMKNAGIVLMDRAPDGISVIDIEQTLKSIVGIEGVHDIHIWEITPGNISVSAHITTSYSETKPLLESAQSILKNKFNCEHITLQFEDRSFSENNGCNHCSMHQD